MNARLDQRDMDLGEIATAEAIAELDVADDPAKWGSRLAHLVDALDAHFRRRGMAAEDALAEARAVVALIAIDQGGRPLYLPRGDRLQRALRDRTIFRLHNGRNTSELARQHGITDRSVQRICREQYALRQTRLNFTDEG